VRAERYRRVVKDALREKREREGLEPVPLAVIASGRLHLPEELPILHNSDARVAIVTAVDEQIDGVEADVAYLLQPVTRELAPALHTLRKDHGIRSIVCEGGPHLNASLFREGLVDELWLCVSPRIAGDPTQPAAVEGDPLPGPLDLDLVSLHEAEAHAFFRYRVRR
jgi:riboflavin biosynthesis pyrimidine reductase